MRVQKTMGSRPPHSGIFFPSLSQLCLGTFAGIFGTFSKLPPNNGSPPTHLGSSHLALPQLSDS